MANKKHIYQPPAPTVIDLAMRADIRGVRRWLQEHPDRINDILENSDKSFKGTLLHAAAYNISQKWQPVYGPIKSIMLTRHLLKQPGINPATCDPTGDKPYRAHLYSRSIVIMDDRYERHKDKKSQPEKIKQAVLKENKERIAYKIKPMSPRREKVFIAGTKFGENLAELVLTFVSLVPLPLLPVVVLSRICTSIMLCNAAYKHRKHSAPKAPLSKNDVPH